MIDVRISSLIIGLMIGIACAAAGAAGAWWYRGQAEPSAVPVAAARPQTPAASAPAAKAVDFALLEQLLRLVDPKDRERIVGSEEAFAQFVEQEARNQSVLSSAYANSADQSAAVQTLMQRAAQRALVESYLNEVVRRNLDPEFPSEDQVKAFYDKNPQVFKLPDRVHVWQIFLPADSSASETARQNAQALGRQIMEELLTGKADFAELAARHSKHEQSRISGGYMGLLAFEELLPDVRKVLEGAAEGKVIGPIQSASGFHILKRGALVHGVTLSYEEARPRIVAQLQREAGARVRHAAVQKIRETYPVAVPEDLLPQWREALQEP